MAIIAYPLNNIDYDAEDAQSYFAPRTAGIFSLGKDYVVSSAGGMDLTVSTGRGWMKPSEFTGFSVVSTEPTALTVAESHPTMDRYDRVVMRYDKGANKVEILLVQGTAATVPSPPDIQRTESMYELGLAVVHVPAGALELTADNIEDTRGDASLCGVIGNDWTVGHSIIEAIFAQSLAGKVYSVTTEKGEVANGIVPDGLMEEIPIDEQNTEYAVTVANDDGEDYSAIVSVGPYYGRYQAFLGTSTPVSEVLEENMWDTIKEIAKSGKAPSIWAVGDKKQIVVNGDVNGVSINSYQTYVFILEFNHNVNIEGMNTIHFGLGHTPGGNLISFIDGYYNTTNASASFVLSKTQDLPGGWGTSHMRTNVLGSNSNPNTPTPGTLLSALPEDLRKVMSSVKKWTNNIVGSLMGEGSDSVTQTDEYLFLLSPYEVSAHTEDVNPHEIALQTQYEYFRGGNRPDSYEQGISKVVNFYLRSRGSGIYRYNTFFYYRSNFSSGGGSPEVTSYPNTSYGVFCAFAV